jgi:alpha-tubulin suppressor-like RCC1 family protein
MKRILFTIPLLFILNVNAQTFGGAYTHSLFICSGGNIYSTGRNDRGQLGDGTTIDKNLPTRVLTSLSDFTAVAAGRYHSMALKSNGTVWSWGFSNYGQLGDGTTYTRYSPVQVITLTSIIRIAACEDFSVALKSDGSVWTWGNNGSGQLGNGYQNDWVANSTPYQVSISGVISIGVGIEYVLALKNDGTVWGWGSGIGLLPTQISNLSNIILLSVGGSHSHFLKSDGTVWAFGGNQYGQIGNGTTASISTPIQINNLTNMMPISAGYGHTIFKKNDGTVWACGYNGFGQLGDGTVTNRTLPVQINTPSQIVTAQASYYHSFFLKDNGTLWGCGLNSSGQLGDSTNYSRHPAVKVHSPCYIAPPVNVNGRLFNDVNIDCINQQTEPAVTHIVLIASPGSIYSLSNDSGDYSLAFNNSNNYILQPIIPTMQQYLIRDICPPDYSVSVNTNYPHDTSGFDFGFECAACWQLRVDVVSSNKRLCTIHTTTISYYNDGTISAPNVSVFVKFDQYNIPVSASMPYTTQLDSSIVFDIGTVGPGQNGVITIADSIVCDVTLTGLTQCTEVWILPPNQCLIDSTTGSGWDHSSVSVDAECINDTCRFVIRNSGSQDMAAPSEYRMYANNVLVYTGNFQLVSGDSLVVLWVSNGATIRLEADQVPGHPGNSRPRATLEACGTNGSGNFTVGEVNRAPMDDADVDKEIDCRPIQNSFDPNIKEVTPQGVSDFHLVLSETQLDYTVHFQNTGTDTAYKVVIIDSVSNDLDLATLELGASSHPYSVSLSGQGIAVLKFTFNNINLVDSTTDELNSHGFVKYKITPKSSVPLGTQINNAADIYFDYNFPVRTNTAFVTLGNYLVLSNGGSKMTRAGSIIFYPNPTSSDVTLETSNDNLIQSVIVYSMDGRLLKSMVDGPWSIVNIDLQGLSPGIYFLDCKTESGSEKLKVVKY